MTTKELLKDESFVKKVSGMKSVEDVQKAFADKGVSISIDELKKMQKAANGELSDGDLESVAGGHSLTINTGRW
jgi:predicted ribosomally synthesized peptide with nif11-like leader